MINFNIEVASEKHIPYVAEILQTIEVLLKIVEQVLRNVILNMWRKRCAKERL